MTFFLGTNTPNGFHSFYDQLIDVESANIVYILKGGPGCGKSTLLRAVADVIGEHSHTQYTACGSDPQSLDAVCFPQYRAAIVDGTTPHVIEPTAPYVIERYINLGEVYDAAALMPYRDQIVELIAKCKDYNQSAVRALRAADSLEDEIFTTVASVELVEKALKRARGIVSRELGRTRGLNGKVTRRFLSAFTADGVVTQWDTVRELCDRVYEIDDSYGLSTFVLNHIYFAAVQAGHELIACYNPMDPERLAHILLPALRLGFITSTPLHRYDGEPDRRVRLDACVPQEERRLQRGRLRFLQKTRDALIAQVTEAHGEVKAHHDALEAMYNPYVDFDLVRRYAERISQEILAFNT